MSTYKPCEHKIFLHVLQKLEEDINMCGNERK